MVGLTVSHYRILGQLGAGGMGAVYRAVDTDLGRPVAIKFLRPEFALQPERRERLLQEARAAAALSHPNICTIHEVGRAGDELFIVMQLVEGRTLASTLSAGPLDAECVGKLAVQLADALSEAHSRGIVHRDLKPSNIMVRRDSDVTILDFGIAAMPKDEISLAQLSTVTHRPLTLPGQAVGTIGYMSPEQIRGVPVGTASDVFSLGVTLYEAAMGRNPFLRGNQMHTLAAVLDDEPPPIRSAVPDFPAHLDEILLKCLDKDPNRRYADGKALAEALRERVSGAGDLQKGRTRYRSLAVLPFANLLRAPENEYLSEALTSEIVTKLARLKGMLVISPSATLRYRDSPLDPRQIGRELDVQTVLEGGISKRGHRCRITIQLLEVQSGFCVWADAYEFAVDDLFDIPDIVASRVARALRTKFSSAGGSEPAGRRNAEAYRLYLQGKTLYYRFNSTDNLLAIEAFRRALAIDARYAPAHAGLASACMARLEREWESDEARWISEALEACNRAIAHDAWSSEAYSARGVVFLRQQRLDEAEAELRRALAITANDDIAHSMLGRILFERGDLHLAIRSYKRALKISPDYVWCWNDLAWVTWLMGRYAETERALARVLTINPVDEIARVGIATGHYFRGELDEAVAAAQKSVEINPHHPFPRPVLAVALAKQGRIAEGEALCHEILQQRPRDFLASAGLSVVYAIADDSEKLRMANDRALSIAADRVPLNVNVAVHFAFLNRGDYARLWLRKAFREGMRGEIVLKHNPLLRQFAPEFLDNNPGREVARWPKGVSSSC